MQAQLDATILFPETGIYNNDVFTLGAPPTRQRDS